MAAELQPEFRAPEPRPEPETETPPITTFYHELHRWMEYFASAPVEESYAQVPEAVAELDALWTEAGMYDQWCLVHGTGYQTIFDATTAEPILTDEGISGIIARSEGVQIQTHAEGELVSPQVMYKFTIASETCRPAEFGGTYSVIRERGAIVYAKGAEIIPMEGLEEAFVQRENGLAKRAPHILAKLADVFDQKLHSEQFNSLAPHKKARAIERFIDRAEQQSGIRGTWGSFVAESVLLPQPTAEQAAERYEIIRTEGAVLEGIARGLTMINRDVYAALPAGGIAPGYAPGALAVAMELYDCDDGDLTAIEPGTIVHVPLQAPGLEIMFTDEA